MSTTNNRKMITWVVETAMLIALLVVVQLLTFAVPKSLPVVSQLFTGSLVNLVLIVGAGTVGFAGAGVAAVLSPVLAFLFGQMTVPQLLPVVMAGNLIIVAIIWAFFKKDRLGLNIAGVAMGAAAKAVAMGAVTAFIVVPVFFVGKPAIAAKLIQMMSVLQLITALIGGAIALAVLPALHRFRLSGSR